MSFQENLKAARKRAGYKQAKEFAEVLGLKYDTYIAYENRVREPKYSLLCKICRLLNTTPNILLEYNEDGEEEPRAILEAAGFPVTEQAGGMFSIVIEQETGRTLECTAEDLRAIASAAREKYHSSPARRELMQHYLFQELSRREVRRDFQDLGPED